MARRRWSEILGTVVISAGTVGAGAFLIDFLKSKGYWPKQNAQIAGEFGCDKCPSSMGNEVVNEKENV